MSDESPAPDPRRAALIGLGLLGVLVVGGLVLAHALRSSARIQDCVMSGRTNCVPIDASSPDNHE